MDATDPAGPAAVVAVALWAMLPAYVPNNVAVVAGGGRPIDGGRTWNGRRLLGDGKTWRGTAAGVLAGVGLAVLANAAHESVGTLVGVGLPTVTLPAAVGLAAGAMLGDVVASFLKRRTGRERGAPVPGLDQLDFAVGAVALAALLDPRWFLGTFLRPATVLVAVVVLTPVLHLGTNGIAYRLGLTNEPY
jgi:CDP-2,3-bis-(O-geranylgeranyl)-sn-glycerol synthase